MIPPLQDSPGSVPAVGILDSYGATLAPPRTARPYNSLDEEATPEPDRDGFQSIKNQWEPMFIDKVASTNSPVTHLFVNEDDLVRRILFYQDFIFFLGARDLHRNSVPIRFSTNF